MVAIISSVTQKKPRFGSFVDLGQVLALLFLLYLTLGSFFHLSEP